MIEPRQDWDDERLAGAFRVRAIDRSTPPDLIVSAVQLVRDRPSKQPGRGRTMRLTLLACAAAVAVLVGTMSVTPRQSGPAATPSTAVGLPILTVSEAIAVRDRGVDSREVAVAAYLIQPTGVRCGPGLGSKNPTLLACPELFTWLMENPERLVTSTDSGRSIQAPTGPAIRPALLLTTVAEAATLPVAVTVLGHFDDRRAALCEVSERTACGDTFVVDRIVALNGVSQPVATTLRQTNVTERRRDLEADVDTLVLGALPSGSILSRQLVAIDQVIGIEPILARDDFVPYVGNPATLVWLVTALEATAPAPRARTFALFDGSNWFAEVTADGAAMLERRATARASGSPRPALPSGDPAAFDLAPSSVLGITVRDIATVMRDRRAAAMDNLGRDEFAIRAWYVGPDPTARCEPTAELHAPTPPCDEARHWLLDRPDQFGVEVGQLRTKPEHWPPVLNPLIPVDVPFDTPPTWSGGVPVPQPVIVLGHYADSRVDTFAGNLYFVIDSLAWARDRADVPIDSLTRLTSAATEDPASVLGRIDAVSPNDAVATWTTVVNSDAFEALEPRTAADAPEFTSGPPVWIVRRLIPNQMDGRQRLAIEWAYTTDHGDRIWLTEFPDSSPDLVPTFQLRDLGEGTQTVRVFDYEDQVIAVRSPKGLDLDWRPIEPHEAGLEVARGASDREIAIRWTAGACNVDWRVLLHAVAGRPGTVHVTVQTFGDYCPDARVARSIVLEFDRPITPDDLITTYNPSGG